MTETPPRTLSHLADADREAFRPLLRERRRELREARRVAEELAERLRLAEAQAAAREGELARVLASRSWRAVAAFRRLRDGSGLAVARAWLRRRGGGTDQAERVAAQAADGKPDLPIAASMAAPRDSYEDWIGRFDTMTPEDEAVLRGQAADPALPGLLLVCPLDAASATEVPGLLAALRRQFFARWRLLLAVRADLPDATAQTVATLVATEPRARSQRGAEGLLDARVGPDERLVVLRPGTLPRDHALGVLAAAATEATVRLVYGDSDRLGPDGRRSEPFFKPAFSPELLHGMDYLGGCVLLGGRTADLDAILHAILTGADPSDAVRRFAAPLRGAAAVHWPEVLSHDLRPPGTARHGTTVSAAAGPDPVVSVIIPTRDRVELLRPCVESVLAAAGADRMDLIIVDNGSTDDATLGFLRDLEGSGAARVLQLPEPFNFSRLNNAAAAVARGEILVFLNNDTVVRDPAWLRCLAAQAVRPDVGAVGAKLLYPDLTVQHGGIVLGINGTVAHADMGLSANDPGAHGLATTTREVSAVTAACLAIRREVFDRIGGFDPDLAVAFNDVRLCLDAVSLGYRNIRLAEPLLVHHEARTRGRDDSHAKVAQFRREAHQARSRHRALFQDDPYYNPNLSLDRVGGLAVPPRWIKPWRRAGRSADRLRVLIAGATHERDRVPAAFIARQAADLLGQGHDIIVAGPRGAREPDYAGCRRIHLTDPKALAVVAITEGVDCVVSHAPLFHPVTRWLGRACRTVVCDYGDPHPALFADADAHVAAVAELQLCRDLADRVLPAVSGGMVMGAPLLGNIAMAAAPDLVAACRARVRAARGWDGRIVILTVVPLARGEAGWSGIPAFLGLLEAMELHHPALASRCVFVANGGGDADELEALAEWGVVVIPDHADQTAELFAAADVYVDLSLSPEFGLGIARALAHGLPVIASDLPAHRNLPIFLADDLARILGHMATLAANALDGEARQPVLYETHDLAREAAATIEAVAKLPVVHTR